MAAVAGLCEAGVQGVQPPDREREGCPLAIFSPFGAAEQPVKDEQPSAGFAEANLP